MNMKGMALSQLPDRFRSKFDTEYEFKPITVNGKQKQKQQFFVKGMPDSPRFDSLKEVHRYIASLETGRLAEYIHRKYGHYGYAKDKSISYNPEFNPHEEENKHSMIQRSDRYRWVENVTDGLRKVGDVDDILPRLGHTGWYTDNWQQETVHGEVYQMPSRGGEDGQLFIPAVNDPNNDDCACLDFTSTTNDKEEAARWADRMAELWAEREREYQAKDDQEQRLADIQEEIKGLYTEFRRVSREIKANCDKLSGVSIVRELVRKEWQRTKSQIHKLRAERDRVEREGIEY